MKGKILQFFVSTFTMFMLIVSTSTVVSFMAPIIGDDALDKAYALGSKKHRTCNTSSGTVDIVPNETGDGIADGNPTVSVPEPSSLILLGSALGAAVLYKRMKSRKRSKSN